MIVLDEQLSGYEVGPAIAQWYRGRVANITEIRPRSHILDEAVPELLRRVSQPLFVTINVDDFWRRVAPHDDFGIACFELANSQAREVSPWLRKLLGLSLFKTRRQRMGKIIKVTPTQILHYSKDSWAIERLGW